MIAVCTVPSEECAAIAFYGIDSGAKAAESFYCTTVEWFNRLGCPPDKVGIKGQGHRGKLGSFALGNAKLQKTGFDGVENFEIVCSTPNAVTGNDFFVTADWSAKYSYAVIAARSSLATLSSASMLPLAQTVVRQLKLEYGIGYTRAHQLGPAMYAIGICQGLGPGGYGVDLTEAEREEADSISRWGDGMTERVWRKGLLRDVYFWNLLTKPQLTKKVGSLPLEQWIQQDESRGKLSTLENGVCLWEVHDADLPGVRGKLREAGIIFDWRKPS